MNIRHSLYKKNKGIVFLSLGLMVVVLLIVSYTYFPKKNDNKSVSGISQVRKSNSTILGLQQVENVTSGNTQNSSVNVASISPTITTEVNPSGFCLFVPVLLYHHIEPIAQAKSEGHAQLTVDANIFDSQMKYLKDNGYKSISAEELVNAIISHHNLGKTVVVTLDDGYNDAYNFAFPIAKKYGIILNLMIPTGLLENKGYMNWGQLKEMVHSGQAQAYDHTWSHFSLPKGDDAKIQMEIMTAKNQLEQNLGKTAKILTYPYGTTSQKVITALQKNGFIAAFSTLPSFYQCDSFLFNLKRNRIGNASLSAYGL
ncbi:polysaccharide deacetylase family protein [Candidatus Gottesmanbacteria bacterium]|nr:polysaccharide deacetylase family protein [Candidatus Gottesmanbacteria bacterium]